MITRLKNILECSINRMQMRIWYIKKGKVKKKFYPPKEYRKKGQRLRWRQIERVIREGLGPSLDFNQFFSSSWQLDIQSESVGQVGIVSVKGGLPRSTRGQFRIKPFLPFVRKGCLQPGVVAIAGGDRIRGRMGSC